MKHATHGTLDLLDGLLDELRRLSGLKEKSRGAFYRKSGAFLHFHEDPAGLFADLKEGGDWVRYAVNTKAEQKRLAVRVRVTLGA
jgi:hypothetical protein